MRHARLLTPRAAACRLALLFMLAATAAGAASFRVEFLALVDGKRVEGAEVCLFEGTTAGALEQFASSGDVRCLPADKVIDLPPGGWNFFCRYGGDRISAWPGMVLVSERTRGGFKKIDVPMVPAVRGRVDESLRGEHVVFYFPGAGGDKLPYAYPLPPGEVELLLPSNTDFIPLVMRDRRVAVAGALQRVSAERRSVTIAPSGAVDVVVPVKMQVMDLGNASPEPPRVTLTLADGRVLEPVTQPRGISRYDLIVFRGVPRTSGPLRLHVGGGAWRTDEATMPTPAANESVATLSEPLETVPGSIVHVNWAIEGAPPPVSASACSSLAETAERPPRVLALHRCLDAFGSAPLSIRLNDCKVVATRVLDADRPRGVESFEGLAAGEYLAQLTANDAVRWVPIRAPDHDTARADATITFSMVFGTITVDGEPAAARIAFATGAGASDASGRYTAVVSSDPGTAAVEVTLCGSEPSPFVVIPKNAIGANATFDVQLSAKPLRVTLRDAATRRPIGGVETMVVFPMNDGEGDGVRMSYRGPASDAAGVAAIRGLSADASVRICGTHPRYRRACTAILARDARDAVLELTPATSFRGRIAGAEGVEGGRFFFVAPSGAVMELGAVRADGTFDFQAPHAAPEYLVSVSRSMPLAVIDRWRVDGEEIALALPPAPLRTVRVTLAPNAAVPRAWIALSVGDRLVPSTAFTFHQAMRRQQPMVVAGGTTVVADVLETAPLSIIRGADPSAPAPDGVDLFTMREYRASFPTVVVRGDTAVLP